MAQAAGRFVEGAVKNGVKKRRRPTTSSSWSTSSPATASTRATRRPMRSSAYHTAYLKANYREEFLAASMTLDMGNTDKLAMFTSEARKSGIAIAAAVHQRLGGGFPAPREQGASATRWRRSRTSARRRWRAWWPSARAKGPFTDLSDFAGRCNPKALNKRALETLAAAGAFDALRPQPGAGARQRRADAGLRQPARRRTRRRAPAICSAAAAATRRPQMDMRAASSPGRRWSGCSTSSRRSASSSPAIRSMPTRRARQARRRRPTPSWRRAPTAAPSAGRLAGIVVSARERRSQKGNKFAFAMFSEPTGQFEAVIFSETLAAEPAPAGARHGGAASPWRASATARRSSCARRASSPWTRPPRACRGASRWCSTAAA